MKKKSSPLHYNMDIPDGVKKTDVGCVISEFDLVTDFPWGSHLASASLFFSLFIYFSR